ncbi:hypothetical protein F4679DRAFT_351201 [Xylaria curta]|nr:hypothetical protein F4679DRAFT_351201 [Xylaria curta]
MVRSLVLGTYTTQTICSSSLAFGGPDQHTDEHKPVASSAFFSSCRDVLKTHLAPINYHLWLSPFYSSLSAKEYSLPSLFFSSQNEPSTVATVVYRSVHCTHHLLELGPPIPPIPSPGALHSVILCTETKDYLPKITRPLPPNRACLFPLPALTTNPQPDPHFPTSIHLYNCHTVFSPTLILLVPRCIPRFSSSD